jgi:hypothetical protein
VRFEIKIVRHVVNDPGEGVKNVIVIAKLSFAKCLNELHEAQSLLNWFKIRESHGRLPTCRSRPQELLLRSEVRYCDILSAVSSEATVYNLAADEDEFSL